MATASFVSRFKRVSSSLLSVIAVFFVVPNLYSSVTLEFYFDDGNLSDGMIAAIVADRDGDGFLDLDDPTVPGTRLESGESIGTSDDVIIALTTADSGSHWTNGAGIADSIERIDYEALGITEGTALILYLFPDASQIGDALQEGDSVFRYRNSEVGGSGGDIPFQAPEDSGVFVLSALVSTSGGDFDPSNLNGSEIYDVGFVGGEDHGDVRSTATMLTSAGIAIPGALEPGDVDFFALNIGGPSRVLFYTTGGTNTVGELYSPGGTLLNNPIEDGDLGDGNNFRIDTVLVAAGTYFLGVSGDGDNQTGDFDLFYEILPFISVRPDATIGRSFSKQRGNDFYNESGARQSLSQRMSGRKTLIYRFTAQNDGEVPNTLNVTGSQSKRYFKSHYFLVTSGRTNVTGALLRQGLPLAVAARGVENLTLEARAGKRSAKKRKSMNKTLLISVRDSGLLDRVRAEVIRR